jgi:hypothetical protein
VPLIALPKTWATCSAIGPSDFARVGTISQLVSERAPQLDVPVGGLRELHLAARTALQEAEHEVVDLRAHGLHHVEGERLATLGVRVHQP